MTSARTLLSAWRLRAKKHFGQNFLDGPDAGRALVSRCGIGDHETVVEIGAGFGALTVALAERARRVIAVERDPALIGALRAEILARGISNVDILAADILKLDLPRMARHLGGRITVAGNLPYNISSQVLVQLVGARASVDRAFLMFQKELAERILSPPGRKSYGRLTVMVNYCADVRKVHELKAAAFFPRPKIDSVVLGIRFREPKPEPATDEAFLFSLIAAAFGQRRKMLRNALGGGRIGVGEEILSAGLSAAGISGERRAETLSVAEYVALGNAITAMVGAGDERFVGKGP
jgi:16S rRNA (adenine1518-N6/adenine1519-N6)-dimethyltransferase